MTTAGRTEDIIDRLHGLYPKLIDLSLDRLLRLLAALGHPEQNLPPVIHVAGTNGKGSTCAFLHAIGEAAGMRVHVYTSPHLVHFNERIRLAGRLVSDAMLSDTLAEVERVNAGQPITVFEVLVAAAFLLFARVPADLCVLEVGLGGRGDATNVISRPASCAITSISLDHREMLGNTIELIASEKAGIMKPGVPVVTGMQTPEVLSVLAAHAANTGAEFRAADRFWRSTPSERGFTFSQPGTELHLPSPSLLGPHQYDNAGIAVAAVLASGLPIPHDAIACGVATAAWPARLQRLTGRLAALLPPDWELWLDGGHNPGAGEMLAAFLPQWRDRPVHLVIGMKKAKDSREFLRPLLPHATTVWAVAEPGQHLALPIEDIIAASGGTAHAGPTTEAVLRKLAADPTPARVLICGSLYLAGEILKADGDALS